MVTVEQVLETALDCDRSVRGAEFDAATAKLEDGQLNVGGQLYRLGEHAETQLVRAVRMPVEFFHRIPPYLQETNVNRLLEERGREREFPLRDHRMFVRDDVVVGFAPNHLSYSPSVPVIRALLSVLGGESVLVQSFALGEDGFKLELVAPGRSVEPQVGDITRGGLVLSHSDVGAYATSVSSYFYRCRCGNGMEVRECERTRRLDARLFPDSQEMFLAQVDRLTRQVWQDLGRKMSSYEALAYQPLLEKPEEWVQSLVGASHLGKRVLDKVTRALLLEPELGATRYAVVQALTWVATHDPEVTSRERRLLQRIAGLTSIEAIHRCPTCRRALRGGAHNN